MFSCFACASLAAASASRAFIFSARSAAALALADFSSEARVPSAMTSLSCAARESAANFPTGFRTVQASSNFSAFASSVALWIAAARAASALVSSFSSLVVSAFASAWASAMLARSQMWKSSHFFFAAFASAWRLRKGSSCRL